MKYVIFGTKKRVWGHFRAKLCECHGPLCQALTNSGLPCNFMVFNLRDGSRYCENVGTEIRVGIHEPSCYRYRREFFSGHKLGSRCIIIITSS